MSKEKVFMEWKLLEHGQSLSTFEIITIKQALTVELSKTYGVLSKIASRLSLKLGYTLGKGHWQIILIKGDYGRYGVSSGGYFAIYQRSPDKMKAIIWMNRLSLDDQMIGS